MRKLSPEEVSALGLNQPRKLTPEQARELGLDSSIQPAPEEPGLFSPKSTSGTALRGVGQGASFGLTDELSGLLGASDELGRRVRSAVGFDKADYNTPVVDSSEPLLSALKKRYRMERDAERGDIEKSKAENPMLYAGTEIGGALLTAPLGGGARTVGGLVKVGAGLGAAQGLGNSRADLTEGEYGQALKDTALGGAMGAGGTLAGIGAAKVAPSVLRATRTALENTAVKQGRRVLLNGADQLSSRAPLGDDAVRAALDSGAIVPFGTNQGALQRLEGSTERLGRVYGEIVEQLEAKGVQGPEARKLADQMLDRYAETTATSGANKAAAEKFIAEGANLESVAGPSGRLRLSQAEKVKRDLQRQAKYERLANNPVEESTQEIASMVRQANEDAIEQAALRAGPGSEIAEIADGFAPVKQRLSRLIEARKAAERGAARGSQRTTSGLVPDRMTLAGAVTSGNPFVLAAAPAASLVKNRLPSTIAASAYRSSLFAKALAEGLQGMPNRVLRGGQLGSASERALDEETLALIEALRRPRE